MLRGYSDSDFAAAVDYRRSSSSFVFVVNGSAVCWTSKQQSLISRSTHNAAYIGLAAATYEASWLCELIHALDPGDNQELHQIGLLGDNQSAIATAHAPLDAVSSPRTKHIDVRFHIIREAITNCEIMLSFIRTHSMIAECLTKALPQPTFERHRSWISHTRRTD